MNTPYLDIFIAGLIRTSNTRPLTLQEKEMLSEFQEIKKQLKTTNEIHTSNIRR
jgi:RNA polymerase-interacting CarD/CdnL/TRCF family regulator